MHLRSGTTTGDVVADVEKVRRPRGQTRLSFPHLLAGLFSKRSNAIRQFQELLLIEWGPVESGISSDLPNVSALIKKARLQKQSEAARLLNQIVPYSLSLSFTRRRDTNDLVVIDHELCQQFEDLCCPNDDFTSLGLVLAGIWSDQTDLQVLATKKFQKMLFDFDSPLRAPFILEYGVIPRFDEFLERKDSPNLQTEAALALLGITSIALVLTDLLIEHGLVEILLKLLDSPSCDVRKEAVKQLGQVAKNTKGRDLVHRHEAVRPLLDKVLRPLLKELDENAKLDKLNENDKLLPILRNATYALLRFCKGEERPYRFERKVTENKYGTHIVTTPAGWWTIKGPHLDKVRAALPELFRLVSLTDEEVLSNACWVLACLTHSTHCKTQVIISDGVCQRLVGLLEHQSPSVVMPALRTLGNIVFRDGIQSQRLADFGALPCLWKLLSKKVEEMEVWRTIASITKWNNRRIKAPIENTNSQSEMEIMEDKKMEVKEKLDKYSEQKLLTFCIELNIPVHHYTARKEDIVPKLMDFLEARHDTTVELLAEKEQSSKGKKRRRESTKNPSSASVSSKGSAKSQKKTETASEKAEKNNVNESEDESEQEKDADEEEPDVSDKLSPSDDELCAAIGEILREEDIPTVSIEL
ncbi:PREDICTED: importin subunit alpha-3-like isoform X2 [Nicotiana attenuata]|uniref:importin subunit alpha-3-like isoform X2 n=1 Tax=Nicotiana attenuata TaxID=49451 RepID=UPI000905B272|nr:PREDICTED: importin subunit alpha-3-like isoform X2 [Nicotiana attenuata]